MPQVRQRDALHVLTKPRLLELADALDLGLPGRLLGNTTLTKVDLTDAVAAVAGITNRDAEGIVNATLARRGQSP